MLASLSEFKFFQSFRVPVERTDDIRFLLETKGVDGSMHPLTDAQLIDVSTAGLGFSSGEKFAQGDVIQFTLQHKKMHLDLTGTIVRIYSQAVPGSDNNKDSVEERRFFYGVELEKDTDLKKFLEQYINTLPYERLRGCLIRTAMGERNTEMVEGLEMFSLMLSLFSDISKFTNKKEFVKNMLEEICRVLEAKRSTLFLINTESNELEAFASIGVDSQILKFDYRQGIAGTVFTSGISLNLDVERDQGRFDRQFDELTGFKTKSIICHPVHNREDKIIGVIQVLNKRNGPRFSIEDEKAMKVSSLVFSSLFHNYSPISEKTQIRRFSTPSDREYALVGHSKEMQGLRNSILKLKDIDAPVLIVGELGTGKGLLAKILHMEGNRGPGPYEVISVKNLTPEQLRTELFGDGPKLSKLEQCKRGTVLIQNIDLVPMNLQAALFELLTGKVSSPSGDLSQVRLICTTEADLTYKSNEHTFHTGLYELLSVAKVEIAPLRRRKGDVEELVSHFLRRECQRQGLLLKQFSSKALEELQDYDWPGNIGELRLCVERAVLYHPKAQTIQSIKDEWLPFLDQEKSQLGLGQIPFVNDPKILLKDRVTLLERELIQKEIQRAHGNKSKAAKNMGISREALRKKMLISEETLSTLNSGTYFTEVTDTSNVVPLKSGNTPLAEEDAESINENVKKSA